MQIGNARNRIRQIGEERDAAHLFEQASFFERLRYGHNVHRLPRTREVMHDRKDRTVRLPIKILRMQHLKCLRNSLRLQHHRTEHGQLRLDALRRGTPFGHGKLLSKEYMKNGSFRNIVVHPPREHLAAQGSAFSFA